MSLGTCLLKPILSKGTRSEGHVAQVKKSRHISLANNETTGNQKKLRNIISNLYDVDMECRFMAAKARGEIKRNNPEFTEKMLPRIFHSFDNYKVL